MAPDGIAVNANTGTTEWNFGYKNEDGYSSFALLSGHQIVPLEVKSVGKISITWVIEILRERERDCNSPQDENWTYR